ncbi:hypothetical protein DPMN_145947 [Dreissena polymorpha]|uniref:Uncharacterized protein n=1 Tax=Dreissena polymorpha TaxID=45954 RepID=A0A9D4F9G3_DREPO|nr:hypothetical protein DPMN_145947 [Dreissena polymorpha]
MNIALQLQCLEIRKNQLSAQIEGAIVPQMFLNVNRKGMKGNEIGSSTTGYLRIKKAKFTCEVGSRAFQSAALIVTK